jgi:hypothetical protein
VPLVLTPPAPVRRLFVEPHPDGAVRVLWRSRGHGDRTSYEVERSLGDGPFVAVRDEYDTDSDAYDRNFGVRYGTVSYRVRAVTSHPRATSRWTYSAPTRLE